ncbi:MAG: cupin [Alphaproteobacteria bacterium]|nr:cupin [Alphaproteobacteria bacterium]
MSTKLNEKTAAEAADRPIAANKLLHEDDKTRITHWTMRPGEQTGWHSHDFDYVVVQLSGGRLHLDYADGSEHEVDYAPGNTLSGSAPIEHNAISVGDEAIVSIEIEIKK